MKYSDQFIHRLKKGDRRVLEHLYQDLNVSLCAFANRYVEDPEAAIDIVQDVFISFWDNRKSVKYGAAIKSFLYSSTRNHCINYLRKKGTKDRMHADYTELNSDSLFEFNVLREEVYNELYHSIMDLPEKSKMVMTLTLNGLSNAEITEELNVSVNTVKTLKRNSYKKLRDRLKDFL
jgi:RNA polymerase sigma-70 factor (ECF subfamily)